MQADGVGWITIDLGADYSVNRVTLDWEAAFAVDYQIQLSEDGSDWTTVASVVGNTTGGLVDFTIPPAAGDTCGSTAPRPTPPATTRSTT